MPSSSQNHESSEENQSDVTSAAPGHENQSSGKPTTQENPQITGSNLPQLTENGVPNTCTITEGVGQVSVKSSRVIKQCGEVDIRSPLDKSTSEHWIRASHILPNGGLVVVDSYNDSIKFFDTKLKLTGHVRLPSIPWNITNVTSKGQVVVTLPGASAGQLYFISATGKPAVVKTVQTYAGCRGIAYFENKLIVMNDKTRFVQVYDTLGKILVQRKANFHWPWYVAVSPITRTMYISDHYDNSVTCTSMDGEVLAVYKHNDLKHPAGLAVHDDGTVFVCGWESNNVHHISAQCRHIETILDNGEVREPQSVCYNSNKNTLYVSEASRHKMKIFKLPPKKLS